MATPGNGQVKLKWDKVDKATSYTILRSTGTGTFDITLTVTAGTNTIDRNVQNGTSYRYKIRASDNNNHSAYSTAREVTPSSTLPSSLTESGYRMSGNQITSSQGITKTSYQYNVLRQLASTVWTEFTNNIVSERTTKTNSYNDKGQLIKRVRLTTQYHLSPTGVIKNITTETANFFHQGGLLSSATAIAVNLNYSTRGIVVGTGTVTQTAKYSYQYGKLYRTHNPIKKQGSWIGYLSIATEGTTTYTVDVNGNFLSEVTSDHYSTMTITYQLDSSFKLIKKTSVETSKTGSPNSPPTVNTRTKTYEYNQSSQLIRILSGNSTTSITYANKPCTSPKEVITSPNFHQARCRTY